MRWWTGKNWQYNRRKAIAIMPQAGDQWAGAAELSPEVEKMMALGLASSDKQPVKLPEYLEVIAKQSSTHRAAMNALMS